MLDDSSFVQNRLDESNFISRISSYRDTLVALYRSVVCSNYAGSLNYIFFSCIMVQTTESSSIMIEFQLASTVDKKSGLL